MLPMLKDTHDEVSLSITHIEYISENDFTDTLATCSPNEIWSKYFINTGLLGHLVKSGIKLD